MSRIPTLRYRCSVADNAPPLGGILMGDGPRVRRGYRILSATKTKSTMVMLGMCTWKIQVEPMGKEAALREIEAGAPHWTIVWDKR